jgi:DNA-binding transcriptional regulator LsrR (DeoR family)
MAQEAQRLAAVRIALGDVEQVPGAQRVALAVQRVSSVLDEGDVVSVGEGDVVKATVRLVTFVEQRQLAGVSGHRILGELENAAPAPKSALAVLAALVSPVSSKKNSRKPLPRRNCPFSGGR